MPIIEEILRTAKVAGASDVHLTVGISPTMRVNGNLIEMDYPRLQPQDTLDIIISIMTEAQRNRFEENGELDMSLYVADCGRCRASVYKQRGSVALAFRLVGMGVPTPEMLGIPASVMELYQKQRGLVLVSGTAGSGKTTTMAALLDMINNRRRVHIITLETPVEYVHSHKMSIVNQREIGVDSDNYTSALQAALKENPDVILVGELQDSDTIQAAIMAAEMGCLVLAAMPATGAIDTIERVIETFPAHKQQRMRARLLGVLEAVISQQLLPRKAGDGRVAAFEVLKVNAAIREAIRLGSYELLAEHMDNVKDSDNITMDEAIYQLYFHGKIDGESAVAFAQEPYKMSQRL